VESAELGFSRRLNVIAGPSDPGKTFAVQCVLHAHMGSGMPPKPIPEARLYTSVVLQIEASGNSRGYARAFEVLNIPIEVSGAGAFGQAKAGRRSWFAPLRRLLLT
jgi:hypothetical protein